MTGDDRDCTVAEHLDAVYSAVPCPKCPPRGLALTPPAEWTATVEPAPKRGRWLVIFYRNGSRVILQPPMMADVWPGPMYWTKRRAVSMAAYGLRFAKLQDYLPWGRERQYTLDGSWEWTPREWIAAGDVTVVLGHTKPSATQTIYRTDA